MADIWFTADNHFGHDNIIDHCSRPWKTAQLMDEAMLEIWNQYVRPRDTVYVLGDFCWEINYDVVMNFQKKLHGNKVFLKGNHDHWFNRERRYMHRKMIDHVQIWMCHYPLRTWPNGINVHGHCHGTLDTRAEAVKSMHSAVPNQFDVGIDTNPEYRPYHWEELKACINDEYISRKHRD